MRITTDYKAMVEVRVKKLKKIKRFCYSLVNIYRGCIENCTRLNKINTFKVQTLYRFCSKNNIINDDNTVNKFITLVIKCIIIEDCVQPNNTKPYKIDTITLGNPNNAHMGKNNIDLIIRDQELFLKTNLCSSICTYCQEGKTLKSFRTNLTLIPLSLIKFSQTELFDHIMNIKTIKSLDKVIDEVMNRMDKVEYNKETNTILWPQIWVKYSGRLLDAARSKNTNWSNIIIDRSRLLYSDSFNRKKGLSKNSLLFSVHPKDSTGVWKLLIFVLFNKDFTSADKQRKRHSIVNFKNSLEYSYCKKNKKSIIYGLYTEFGLFLHKLRTLKWNIIYYGIVRDYKVKDVDSQFRRVPVNIVYKFVKCIVKLTVTDELLGGPSNHKRFLKVCSSIIKLNRGENITMSQIMQNIKAKECIWIKHDGHYTKGQVKTILSYLCRIIFMLIEHFIIPVLRRHFYITDAGFSMYKLHYIRKSHWFKMVESANSRYSSSDFKSDVKNKGFLRVRWVPKQHGTRPIINYRANIDKSKFLNEFSRANSRCYNKKYCSCYHCYINPKDPAKNQFKSLNNILRLAQQALSVNCKINKKLLGYGVTGFPNVYKVLKSWWNQLLTIIKQKYPDRLDEIKLYKVTADLSKCYENISHSDLLNILNKTPLLKELTFCRVYKNCILKSEAYGKRLELVTDGDCTRKRLNKLQYNSLVSTVSGGCIITSKYSSDKFLVKVQKSDILAAIIALVKSQQIHLPKTCKLKYISTDVGIPQGCSISGLLCNLYLGDKESDKRIHEIVESNKMANLLLRWVDDFIFISPSLVDIASMNKLLSEGRVFNNVTNDHKSNMQWVNAKFDFNVKSGFINVRINPWKDCNLSTIRDSLSLSKSYGTSFMFNFLEQRLMGYIQNKLGHKLFTCTRINNKQCVIENAYIVMRITSLKLKCGMQSLVENFGGFINPDYLVKLSLELVSFVKLQVSKGGLNPKVTDITEILIIAILNSFKNTKFYKFVRKLKCHTRNSRDISDMIDNIENNIKWPR